MSDVWRQAEDRDTLTHAHMRISQRPVVDWYNGFEESFNRNQRLTLQANKIAKETRKTNRKRKSGKNERSSFIVTPRRHVWNSVVWSWIEDQICSARERFVTSRVKIWRSCCYCYYSCYCCCCFKRFFFSFSFIWQLFPFL